MKFIIFADDTTILCSGKNVRNVQDKLNRELIKVNSWFQTNKLSLNISKTSYMVFYNGKGNTDLDIQINGSQIERVHVAKFLVVYIDEKLSWKRHTAMVREKVAKSIGIINKVKNILNTKSLFSLYFIYSNTVLICQ